jgi:hypothetical protein
MMPQPPQHHHHHPIHQLWWNTDVSKFLQTAAQKKLFSADDEEIDDDFKDATSIHFIRRFVERQEDMEDSQDLVMYRMTTGRNIAGGKKNDALPLKMMESMSALQISILLQWKMARKKSETVITAKAKQIYVAFWPTVCLAGMVMVLLQFLVFYRGRDNGIPDMDWSKETMTKHMAMLLSFCFSGLAWTLSNGLVLNPRKNIVL